MPFTRRQFIKASGGAAAAAALSSLTVNGCGNQDTKLNFLNIFSDELAPEYLSCYGGPYATPNLDALAQEGVRFTQAYTTSPMCTPARFSILSGQYPGRCAHPAFLKEFPKDQPYSIAWNTSISPANPSIARILSENGYYTGMAGKWHIGQWPADVTPPKFTPDDDPANPEVDQKLRTFHKLASEQVKQDAGFDYAESVSWGNFDGFAVEALRFHNFPWITKGAVQFLESAKEKEQPFFLYVATTAVHGPQHAESLDFDPRFTPGGRDEDVLAFDLPDKETLRRKFASLPTPDSHKQAGMACLDHHVGVLIKKLKSLGQWDNTVVLFFADHNIEPGKATCYEKGYKIPMIVRWPGRREKNITSKALLQSVDMFPTLLAAAGIPIPTDAEIDGQAKLSVFQGFTQKGRKRIYYESGYARGLSDGRYKYIALRFPEPLIEKMEKGELEYAPNYLDTHKQGHSQIAIQAYPHYFDPDQLYDLENDPYELKNLAENPEYEEILKRLKSELAKKLATFGHPFNLNEQPFLKTQRFIKMADKTRAIGTGHIGWIKRDHGKIVWPPS